jgi:hypothetical protein
VKGKSVIPKQRVLGAFLAGAALAGAGLATATPAQAAPYWQAVDTDSNWTCSAYQSHRLSFTIKFKTCIVRNSNNDAQSVLVVQNSGTRAAEIRGEVDDYTTSDTWTNSYRGTYSCKLSTLNPGFTRGCFGTTMSNTNRVDAYSTLFMNGDDEINASTGSWYG